MIFKSIMCSMLVVSQATSNTYNLWQHNRGIIVGRLLDWRTYYHIWCWKEIQGIKTDKIFKNSKEPHDTHMYHSDDIRTKAIYTYIHPHFQKGTMCRLQCGGSGDGSYKLHLLFRSPKGPYLYLGVGWILCLVMEDPSSFLQGGTSLFFTSYIYSLIPKGKTIKLQTWRKKCWEEKQKPVPTLWCEKNASYLPNTLRKWKFLPCASHVFIVMDVLLTMSTFHSYASTFIPNFNI